jgi:ribonucleoside-diphosphate reductase alpha chain
MAKEGSTLSGIMDAFALSVSISLQYGVPLRALVDKFVNSRFEPSGYTGNPKIRYAKSVVDYLGRWLGGKFISPDYLDNDAAAAEEERVAQAATPAPAAVAAPKVADPETITRPRAAIEDAPYCSECGMLMTPNGSCYKCSNCGSTSGCS